MATRIVFPEERRVELESFSPVIPKVNEIKVKNHYTLMSTGTENIVFNRLFDENTHWSEWVKYPFYPGYAAIGEVTATGSEVNTFKTGDIVVHRNGHASEEVQNESKFYAVPQGIAPLEAVWFALAKISFMGALAANYFLGDKVLIVGAGPIGQTSIRWARAAGASMIVAVDLLENRLALAERGGADFVFSSPLCDHLKKEFMELAGGDLFDIVIDTTGNEKVFKECLGFARKRGKVIILGDTGSPARQCLSPDVITRGLSIIGAHDVLSGGEWPDQKIFDLFFTLLKTGRFDMKEMNTHIFTPKDCKKAYSTANQERDSTMGIVFDWTK